jgi:hypothetical protein
MPLVTVKLRKKQKKEREVKNLELIGTFQTFQESLL